MQGLDLAALRGETPTVTGVPAWAHVVLGNVQGPLVMEGRLEGHPVVAFTFDPGVTGLEKSLAYPLLISNATSFLLTPNQAPSEPFDRAESDIRPSTAPTFDAPSTAEWSIRAGSSVGRGCSGPLVVLGLGGRLARRG
jgi:hypothetical protein